MAIAALVVTSEGHGGRLKAGSNPTKAQAKATEPRYDKGQRVKKGGGIGRAEGVKASELLTIQTAQPQRRLLVSQFQFNNYLHTPRLNFGYANSGEMRGRGWMDGRIVR